MDCKDLSVYITGNTAGQITDDLVMSKKKMEEPKYERGIFDQLNGAEDTGVRRDGSQKIRARKQTCMIRAR